MVACSVEVGVTVQGKNVTLPLGEQVVNRFVEAGRGCCYFTAGQAVTENRSSMANSFTLRFRS
ncbi:MAG: hypothetical protein ACLS4H_04705 [Streptococcus salivarius]